MIYYRTACMVSTETRARIFTFVVNTSQMSRTFLVNSAFWFAFNVGVSFHSWQASA